MRKWPDVHARFDLDVVQQLVGNYDAALSYVKATAGTPDEEAAAEGLNFIGHQLAREVPALLEEVLRWRTYQLDHAGHVPPQREAEKPEPVVIYEAV